MACDILDFRCMFVSEIIGNVILAGVIAVIMYFVIAGKLKLGFDTTMYLFIPIILIFGLLITGFSTLFLFVSVVAGVMLAWVFNQIISNR